MHDYLWQAQVISTAFATSIGRHVMKILPDIKLKHLITNIYLTQQNYLIKMDLDESVYLHKSPVLMSIWVW